MGRKMKDPDERPIKTTISIDGELYQQTKEACSERGETFSRFFSDALRTRLAIQGERVATPIAVVKQIKELNRTIKKIAKALDVELDDE